MSEYKAELDNIVKEASIQEILVAALSYISDIGYGCNSCNTVESLKALIDEMSSTARAALNLDREHYAIRRYVWLRRGTRGNVKRRV
ncbi:MAG: hypothetical protein AB1330_00965 [Bacillota bacterium]